MQKKKMTSLFIISLFCLASSLQIQNSTVVDAFIGSLNEDFSTTYQDPSTPNVTVSDCN